MIHCVRNGRGVDDVTESPLDINSHRRLPNMKSEDFPSITDEPSMSSSIIETAVLNQNHNINEQHNVTGKRFGQTLANSQAICFF